LTEIASNRFMTIANGKPTGGASSYKGLIKSVDQVTRNPAAKKLGNIDSSNIYHRRANPAVDWKR
jgi:hypothetical protein